MTEAPRLELRGLRKSFGALRVTEGVSLTVQAGELHALIGPNGAGKTTLTSLRLNANRYERLTVFRACPLQPAACTTICSRSRPL